MAAPLLEPGEIGSVPVRNRIIRAATSETMAGPNGEVTDELVSLHEELARGGVGLNFTGHMYCDDRGRYGRHQTGIYSDELIPGLQRLTAAVHRHGGKVFAQLAHAGSQTPLSDVEPIAPSSVANHMTGRQVAAASPAEVEATIAAFGEAATRAAEAGFDGVHIHGANGYLISEFRSPLSNRRDDEWGGSAEARERFPAAVVAAVRAALPADRGLTMKLGFRDAVEEQGLEVDQAVAGAQTIVAAGLDGIEVSSNLMADYVSASIRAYIAVDRAQAVRDLLPHRLFRSPEAEAYFLPWARALREKVDTKIVLVGGLRRTETMTRILEDGDADFVSLSRPLLREPDLVRKLEAGRTGLVDCTSCNICVQHMEIDPLQCWRTPRRRLFQHAFRRFTGRLNPKRLDTG
ncbi:MAG: NADH:flavin oxidoreductase [Solirubrobacterales bacterium]